jgi:hypothetical protein
VSKNSASKPAESGIIGGVPLKIKSVKESLGVLGPEEEAAEGEGKVIQPPVLPRPWMKTM